MTSRRKPPAQVEAEAQDRARGAEWLGGVYHALHGALEAHEKGGKHRPAPPDNLNLREVARELGKK